MDIILRQIEPFVSVMFVSFNVDARGNHMKNELWSKVKAGDYLIYADEDDGVQKVKVTEIDITITFFVPEYRREQPYGLTAETGIVRIKWNTTEIVANLADLIRYDLTWYAKLKKAYDDWQTSEETADAYKEVFLAGRAELREK